MSVLAHAYRFDILRKRNAKQMTGRDETDLENCCVTDLKYLAFWKLLEYNKHNMNHVAWYVFCVSVFGVIEMTWAA